jgi:hypothetical protein
MDAPLASSEPTSGVPHVPLVPSAAAMPSESEQHPQPLGENIYNANTWAERNPHKPVQPVRTRAKATDAQKNAQKIAAARNKEAKSLLSADILALVATRKTQIEELAVMHSVTSQHIEKLVENSTHYKKSRAPNIANALVHMKSNELNDGTSQCSVTDLAANELA